MERLVGNGVRRRENACGIMQVSQNFACMQVQSIYQEALCINHMQVWSHDIPEFNHDDLRPEHSSKRGDVCIPPNIISPSNASFHLGDINPDLY